jgi:hypothetical protein
MSHGREVIVQGAFLADNWAGRTDVLCAEEVTLDEVERVVI